MLYIECQNFMNRKDPAFKELTGALQVTCRELHREGVGANVKHAAVFSPAEENVFWDLKAISDRAPLALQRSVFFYVGKVFCLRGGQEQRDLKILSRMTQSYRIYWLSKSFDFPAA